jgi:hypothetical protein
MNSLYFLALIVNFSSYKMAKRYKCYSKYYAIVTQILTFVLEVEAIWATSKRIEDIDSEPFVIAIFASTCFNNFNARDLLFNMIVCLIYFFLRSLDHVENKFRLYRYSLFYGVAFFYLYFFTRCYFQRERDIFV